MQRAISPEAGCGPPDNEIYKFFYEKGCHTKLFHEKGSQTFLSQKGTPMAIFFTGMPKGPLASDWPIIPQVVQINKLK